MNVLHEEKALPSKKKDMGNSLCKANYLQVTEGKSGQCNFKKGIHEDNADLLFMLCTD